MIKAISDLGAIKRAVAACENKRVEVKFNMGRNKIVRFIGTVSGVYPEVFTVQPSEKGFFGKTCYSYTEILCGEVKLSALPDALPKSV